MVVGFTTTYATYNSSRLDNPVSVSFPIDFKALTFNLLQRPNIYIYIVL
jgi:hypothetical protein